MTTTDQTAAPRTPPTNGRNGRRVALLIPGLDVGGGERISLLLGKELAAMGWAVDLVVGHGGGPLRDEVPQSLRVIDLGAPRLRSGLVPLVRYLRSERPAFLLPTIGHADLLAMLAVRVARTGTQAVPRVSNTLSRIERPSSRQVQFVNWLAQVLYRSTPVVVACSHGMGRDLVEHVGVAAERVRVLPNAVVSPELQAKASEPVAHPWFADTTPVLLNVASLITQKNQALLLDALALVRREQPVRLVVLGEGELRPQLQARADELGLRDAVDFAGTDTNPFRYMARCDAFVLSSDWEGLPGVLIEALACGANVVSTDCPSGPHEILDGGRHGRLVPPGDPRALADAILASLDDPISPAPASWAPYTATGSARSYDDLLTAIGAEVG